MTCRRRRVDVSYKDYERDPFCRYHAARRESESLGLEYAHRGDARDRRADGPGRLRVHGVFRHRHVQEICARA